MDIIDIPSLEPPTLKGNLDLISFLLQAKNAYYSIEHFLKPSTIVEELQKAIDTDRISEENLDFWFSIHNQKDIWKDNSAFLNGFDKTQKLLKIDNPFTYNEEKKTLTKIIRKPSGEIDYQIISPEKNPQQYQQLVNLAKKSNPFVNNITQEYENSSTKWEFFYNDNSKSKTLTFVGEEIFGARSALQLRSRPRHKILKKEAALFLLNTLQILIPADNS